MAFVPPSHTLSDPTEQELLQQSLQLMEVPEQQP